MAMNDIQLKFLLNTREKSMYVALFEYNGYYINLIYKCLGAYMTLDYLSINDSNHKCVASEYKCSNGFNYIIPFNRSLSNLGVMGESYERWMVHKTPVKYINDEMGRDVRLHGDEHRFQFKLEGNCKVFDSEVVIILDYIFDNLWSINPKDIDRFGHIENIPHNWSKRLKIFDTYTTHTSFKSYVESKRL